MAVAEAWIEDLRDRLGAERVLSSPSDMRAYDCDAYTVDRSAPMAVVLPESTQECADIIRFCHQHEIPFTPRGAGTGLSGGALAAKGGVLISTKRMTRILEVDAPNRMLLAQAGAVNTKLTQAVLDHGLHFAPDPSSQSVSTLGGNIAENSGGPHTLKYGVTAQHILALTMVAFDGSIVHLGSKTSHHPGLDLLSLVVGSEGTLGLVTEAWVRLTPLPESTETALASFPDVRSATETVAAIIARGIIPAALEMLDHNILDAVSAAFGLDFPEGTGAALLIEADGEPESTREAIQTVEEVCREHNAIEVRIAQNEDERKFLWTARKKGIGAMGRIAPTLVTHDGVIPRSKLPEMLEYVYEVADEHGVKVANMFHAGDGNLHPIFCFDDREPGVIERVAEAGEKLIRRCIELGGSISGEHGVGVEKVDLMKLMFTPEDLQLQQDAKSIFHQSEFCNPCKVIPNQKGCVEHMRRWRGVAT